MRSVILMAAAITALSPTISAAEQTPAYGSAAPKGTQMRDVIAKLSPLGQEIFRNDWLAIERQATIQRRNAAHMAEDSVFDAMAAEPFNASALRHSYDVLRLVNANNQRQRHEHLIAVLAKLSPSDRATVVTMLRSMRDERNGR
jgi:uncharacterized membrane protein